MLHAILDASDSIACVRFEVGTSGRAERDAFYEGTTPLHWLLLGLTRGESPEPEKLQKTLDLARAMLGRGLDVNHA
eukprot:2041365-Prymnesium_polylepis.1